MRDSAGTIWGKTQWAKLGKSAGPKCRFEPLVVVKGLIHKICCRMTTATTNLVAEGKDDCAAFAI